MHMQIHSERDRSHVDSGDDLDATAHQDVPVVGPVKDEDITPSQGSEVTVINMLISMFLYMVCCIAKESICKVAKMSVTHLTWHWYNQQCKLTWMIKLTSCWIKVDMMSCCACPMSLWWSERLAYKFGIYRRMPIILNYLEAFQ